MASYIFYLVNLKLVSRPIWISNCKKVCRQKLLDIDKIHDLLSSLLKYDSLINVVNIFFFHGIVIVTSRIVNSKSLRKICRQILSTMNVNNYSLFVVFRTRLRRAIDVNSWLTALFGAIFPLEDKTQIQKS